MTVPNATKSYHDAEGKSVNDCPQDPMIVDRFVHMFRHFFGQKFTIFSSGEGGGWASLVALRTGSNAVVTESNSYSYYYLTQRLIKEAGLLILSESNKKKFWQKIHDYCSSHAKENKEQLERVEYLVQKLNASSSFNGIGQNIITQIIQIMAAEQIDPREIEDNSLVAEALRHIEQLKGSDCSGGTSFSG